MLAGSDGHFSVGGLVGSYQVTGIPKGKKPSALRLIYKCNGPKGICAVCHLYNFPHIKHAPLDIPTEKPQQVIIHACSY
jgi:hypothetical protein